MRGARFSRRRDEMELPVFDSCGRGLYSALDGSQSKPRAKWYPGGHSRHLGGVETEIE